MPAHIGRRALANFFKTAYDRFTGKSDDTDPASGMEIFDLDDADDADDDFEKLDGGAFTQIGTTAQTISDGFVAIDDPDPAMQSNARYAVYNRMLHDVTIIAASVRLFLNLISKSNWSVVPPKDESGDILPGAQELADLVDNMRGDITTSWPRVIRRIAMYIFVGYSVHEWTAIRREDGNISIGKIGHRPQSSIFRWDMTEETDVMGVWQRLANGKEVLIPRAKMIYAVDDALTDHPEGTGLFRHLRRATKRLKAFEDLEEVGYENDLRGIPVASIPMGEIDRKAKKLGKGAAAYISRVKAPFMKFVKGHVRNKKQGMLIDSETYRAADEARSPSSVRKWGVELLQGESSAFDSMANAIKRIKEEIALALGTEHLLIGQDGTGSLALSKTKTGTFYLTLISVMQELVDIMQRDWLDPIWEMNGFPDELKPKLAAEEIRDEDIEKITSALERIVRAGGMVGDEAFWEVLDMMGLSRPSDDEILDDELDQSLNPGGPIPPDPNDPNAIPPEE